MFLHMHRELLKSNVWAPKTTPYPVCVFVSVCGTTLYSHHCARIMMCLLSRLGIIGSASKTAKTLAPRLTQQDVQVLITSGSMRAHLE